MKNTKHGMTDSKLYCIWGAMVQRCHNKKNVAYKNYGRRGIKVCNEWRHSANTFLQWAMQNGYKQGLTIERTDNNGGYNPKNCSFVTRTANNTNKRVYRRNRTGYSGVTPRDGRFRVRLRFNGILFNIGTYKTIAEAVSNRNKFIITRNFPHKLQELI